MAKTKAEIESLLRDVAAKHQKQMEAERRNLPYNPANPSKVRNLPYNPANPAKKILLSGKSEKPQIIRTTVAMKPTPAKKK